MAHIIPGGVGTPFPPLLAVGARVGPWVVTRRIGRGTFSEVFEARHHASEQTLCALKVDKPGLARQDGLQHESAVLQQLQRFACVPRHYGLLDAPLQAPAGSGAGAGGAAPAPRAKVLAMQLLGGSVSSARAALPGEQFPLGAALALAAQMLAAVEAVHCAGFVHRDVKPSNFALGLPARGAARGTLHVLDFGQSRRYVAGHEGAAGGCGEPRAARVGVDFRGTSLYSSLHAHRREDLSRRDDLWSWFYVTVDLARGGLPWRPFKSDRAQCGALKAHYAARPRELVAGLPGEGELLAIHSHLAGLSFSAKPDYALLAGALRRAADAAAAVKGALTARPRHAYAPSLELAAALLAPRLQGGGAGGGAGAPLGLAAGSGGGPAPAAAPPPTAPLLLPELGAAAASAEDGERDADADAIAAYDQRLALSSGAALLHCRGGSWDRPHTHAGALGSAGVPLGELLAVGPSGEPTRGARRVVADLECEIDACEALLVGFEAEGESGGGGSGAAGAAGTPLPPGLACRPRPATVFRADTLRSWVRPGFVSLLPRDHHGGAAVSERDHVRSPASTLRGAHARLSILHHALVWGAWDAASSSSGGGGGAAAAALAPSTAAAPAPTFSPGPAAVLAYLASWCGLAEAVLALPFVVSTAHRARAAIAARAAAAAPQFAALPALETLLAPRPGLDGDDSLSEGSVGSAGGGDGDDAGAAASLAQDCAAVRSTSEDMDLG